MVGGRAFLLLVLVPLTWAFVRDLPTNDAVERVPLRLSDLTIWEALRSPAFWIFAMSSSVFGLVYSGISALAFGRPTPEEQVKHARNMVAYREYLATLVAAKAAERDDDFASALLTIHDENPDALTGEEIISILYSLTFAGHETTNNLIANLVYRLLEKPERWDAVVADHSLIPSAVEETLRYDSSVPVWRRVTRRPVTLGGVDLPEGAKLFLWLAASGRDSSVFPEPETFNLRRSDMSKSLAFGLGIHYCLGAALGKLEARLALEALTIRFPKLRLVAQQLSFHPNISFRGPQSLWVSVKP